MYTPIMSWITACLLLTLSYSSEVVLPSPLNFVRLFHSQKIPNGWYVTNDRLFQHAYPRKWNTNLTLHLIRDILQWHQTGFPGLISLPKTWQVYLII